MNKHCVSGTARRRTLECLRCGLTKVSTSSTAGRFKRRHAVVSLNPGLDIVCVTLEYSQKLEARRAAAEAKKKKAVEEPPELVHQADELPANAA